ncbi:hypothetical protein EOA60_22320, partial [Mesorhizobium sp. M1A.F.Ca.IN.020.06.1.1]
CGMSAHIEGKSRKRKRATGKRPHLRRSAHLCMSPRSVRRFWDNDMHQNSVSVGSCRSAL